MNTNEDESVNANDPNVAHDLDHFSPDPYHSNYINRDQLEDIKKINSE